MARFRHAPTRNRGGTIVEWVASAVIFIPLLVAVVLIVCEISRAYTIKVNLEEAAKRAARQLAIDYGMDPVGGTSLSHQASVYSNVRIAGYVQDNSQFSEAAYDASPPWPSPPTVGVVVSYPSDGIAGVLPRFPDPDPLHLSGSFKINSLAVFPLL